MAQCMRRPALYSIGLLKPRFEQRCFSVTPWASAMKPQGAQQPRQPPAQSMRVAAQDNSRMLSDMGLLPGTFVTPSGSNRPSLFTSPKALASIQWARVKRRLADAIVMFIYALRKKPRFKLRLRQTAPAAVALHRQMYTAFAERDANTLRNICCDGILETLITRIAHTKRGEKLEWELVKYTRRPKIMSHRCAALPIDGMGLRQAVVRICSKQKLTRYKADGSIYKGSGKVRDVKEYVVVQRMMKDSKEEEWKLWGTTEETTLKDLDEEKLRLMN